MKPPLKGRARRPERSRTRAQSSGPLPPTYRPAELVRLRAPTRPGPFSRRKDRNMAHDKLGCGWEAGCVSCARVAKFGGSDSENLLLLGLELLVAEDALVPQLGGTLQLAHVFGLGCSRAGRRRLHRLLAASEVLLHSKPVLDE